MSNEARGKHIVSSELLMENVFFTAQRNYLIDTRNICLLRKPASRTHAALGPLTPRWCVNLIEQQ